jgi:hypothetical protein
MLRPSGGKGAHVEETDPARIAAYGELHLTPWGPTFPTPQGDGWTTLVLGPAGPDNMVRTNQVYDWGTYVRLTVIAICATATP